MPKRNTTPKTEGCETCASKQVCRYIENVKAVASIAKALSFSCKYYRSPSQLNNLGTCDLCGKPSEDLLECQKCHKKICRDCADITDMLDVNNGGSTEEVLCLDCEKEEW